MAVSLQGLYPLGEETHFDYAYYKATHIPLAGQHMRQHMESASI